MDDFVVFFRSVAYQPDANAMGIRLKKKVPVLFNYMRSEGQLWERKVLISLKTWEIALTLIYGKHAPAKSLH